MKIIFILTCLWVFWASYSNPVCIKSSCLSCVNSGCWFAIYNDDTEDCSHLEQDVFERRNPVHYVGPYQFFECPVLPTTPSTPSDKLNDGPGVPIVIGLVSSLSGAVVVGSAYYMYKKKFPQLGQRIRRFLQRPPVEPDFHDLVVSDDEEDDNVLYQSPRCPTPVTRGKSRSRRPPAIPLRNLRSSDSRTRSGRIYTVNV